MKRNQQLLIIVLASFSVGMLLTVPTVFITEVFFGGLLVGFVGGLIGYFALSRADKKEEIEVDL